MKFELKRLTDYSDEAIINEIRRVSMLVDEPKLSRKEFRKHSRVCPTTIGRRFGNWEKALQAAGLADRFNASSKLNSNEEVIAELQRVASLLGALTFTRLQFNANARFTDAVARRAFGSWHKAMKAAGLNTTSLGKRYTDEECFENLLDLWTHYGRPPKHDEMQLPPSTVGPKAYVRRFGTWTKALQAFVEFVEGDKEMEISTNVVTEGSSIEIALENSPERASVPESERHEIRLGLRT